MAMPTIMHGGARRLQDLALTLGSGWPSPTRSGLDQCVVVFPALQGLRLLYSTETALDDCASCTVQPCTRLLSHRYLFLI
jgi:hypothetical protein